MGIVSMNCGAEHRRDLPCVTDSWGTEAAGCRSAPPACGLLVHLCLWGLENKIRAVFLQTPE